MALLALEFSSTRHSVSVIAGKQPDAPIYTQVQARTPGIREIHSSTLIDAVLNEAGVDRSEIDGIAVGLGPGSYTGIRVAISWAQGWEFGTGGKVRLVGVPSLDILVGMLVTEGMRGKVAVAFDAQRGDLYLAPCVLGEENRTVIGPLELVSSSEVEDRLNRGQVIVGPDLGELNPRVQVRHPSSEMLARLALREDGYPAMAGNLLTPVYLRETQFVKVAGGLAK